MTHGGKKVISLGIRPVYERRQGSIADQAILDYVPRHIMHLRDLSENHLNKIKSVKFDYKDYKVYEKMACVPYERMVIQCANNYGIIKALENLQCREILQFFKTCLQNNQVFGQYKKMAPETFVTNKYSREKPNFSQIAI